MSSVYCTVEAVFFCLNFLLTKVFIYFSHNSQVSVACYLLLIVSGSAVRVVDDLRSLFEAIVDLVVADVDNAVVLSSGAIVLGCGL